MSRSSPISTKLPERDTFAFPSRSIAPGELWAARVVTLASLTTIVTLCVRYGWSHLQALWMLLAITLGLGWIAFRTRKHRIQSTLRIDWQARTLELEERRLGPSGPPWNETGSKVVDLEVVPFAAITGAAPCSTSLNTGGVVLLTPDDCIEIPDGLKRFPVFLSHLEQILRENGGDDAALQRALSTPVPRAAPWWGWLLLVIGAGSILFVCWLFMFTDYFL